MAFAKPLDREGAAAATSARGLWVLELKTRPHHRGDIVDLETVEVLGAERIHVDLDACLLEHFVVFFGTRVQIDSVLEPGATSREHGYPEPGFWALSEIFEETLNLFDRTWRQGENHFEPSNALEQTLHPPR